MNITSSNRFKEQCLGRTYEQEYRQEWYDIIKECQEVV